MTEFFRVRNLARFSPHVLCVHIYLAQAFVSFVCFCSRFLTQCHAAQLVSFVIEWVYAGACGFLHEGNKGNEEFCHAPL